MRGGECEVVGEENQGPAALGVPVADAAQRRRVVQCGVAAGEPDRLIADDARRAIDLGGVATSEAEVLLGPGDEETPGLV